MKFKYIERNPEILGGKPVFKGTRIPVYLILDFLSAGETIDNILENYPQLSKEAVLEAIKYASEYARLEEELIEVSN
ncbi:DUF433 domain-containing protein [Persephonella sp.]|uniref:DUF433 domain-containing protein n=1 Tax=Persephonella sp. TaxID=2060922 RepID=UPI00262076BC|nr:DUF433 domain-containing protein [Persephonella sp.]